MTKRKGKSNSQRECGKCDKLGKLIAALMASDVTVMGEIEQRLSQEFGEIDLMSTLFPFNHTNYYTKEMGPELHKKFISFYKMVAVENLPDIKNVTNNIEQQYAIDGKRRINIDPGYVTHAQMVLATTKPYSHRIYLGKGIFAELTYLCKGKAFYPLEWTYPDYREQLSIDFFQQVRKKYLQQMQELRRQNSIT